MPGLTSLRAVIAALVLFAVSPLAAQDAVLVDELEPIYPDRPAIASADPFAADTPRGVPAAVHVLITGLPAAAPVKARLEEGGAPVSGASVSRLIPVPVEQNTGLDSRTEAFRKTVNPHVIRRAPFSVYEVIEPIYGKAGADTTAAEASGTDTIDANMTAADANGVLALRIELPVPADAKPRTRRLSVVLESGDWCRALGWNLRVHNLTVPPTSRASRGYTNWFSPDLIARRHGLEPWSEPHWAMLARYADLMAQGRQNTFWIRWSDFVKVGVVAALPDASVPSAPTVTLETDRLARYVTLFVERGFTRIEGGHLARRHKNDWSLPRLDVTLTGTDTATREGRAQLRLILHATQDALAGTGHLDTVDYLQHISDEPTDTNAGTYKAIAAIVRREIPGVKIFEATMSRTLVGAVDHWCPQIQKFQQNRDFFETRRKAGDAIWVYTCLIPGGPWLNRLLDQERLRPVWFGWALEKYDLAGYLHWGLNHYRSGVDPFKQSVVPHGKGPPNFLPAGDSHVVYPGKDGPLSGIRFEAHRIGMEDAELLRLLRERDAERADAIIGSVFRAFDDYETDVAAYRAAKRKLLEALAP